MELMNDSLTILLSRFGKVTKLRLSMVANMSFLALASKSYLVAVGTGTSLPSIRAHFADPDFLLIEAR